MSDRSAAIIRLALGGALVIAGAVAAFVFQPSREEVESAFGVGGPLGPVLYGLAYAILTVAFVPGLPLTLGAGALYGAAGGSLVSIVGATIGATLAFLVARRGAGDSLDHVRGKRLRAIEERLEGKGFVGLLVLRLIPIVPFNALNYVAGASSLSTRDYVIATAFGIVPGAIVYASLGAGIDDPASPLFAGAVASAVALALVARGVASRFEAEQRDGSDDRM